MGLGIGGGALCVGGKKSKGTVKMIRGRKRKVVFIKSGLQCKDPIHKLWEGLDGVGRPHGGEAKEEGGQLPGGLGKFKKT